VDFRQYVAVVLRAEYSGAAFTTNAQRTLWYSVGAISVKQYAWYYAMHWRGGNLNGDCYDVKDSTADQLYQPEKNTVVKPDQEVVIDATWNISLRKTTGKKPVNKLFLTGYRSGQKVPCGSDANGYKIYQKSLKDCVMKALTLEEIFRLYYEPTLQIVDVRGHDVLADGGSWRGDAVLTTPSATPGDLDWQAYPATGTGFDTAVGGTFDASPTNVADQGLGDVNGDNHADLVLLLGGDTKQIRVASASGTGYDTLGDAQPADQGIDDTMLVADFNGDRLADVGLFSTAAPNATLKVMLSLGNGSFAPATDWWTGPLDLSANHDQVLAGDVNGDGKADLIIRDNLAPGVQYLVAPSLASCADRSAMGACPVGAVGTGLGAATTWSLQSSWATGDLETAVGDYDRDGRDDLFVAAKDGTGIKVLVLRAKMDGGFADPLQVWQQTATSIDSVTPISLNGDADGYADLAFFQKDGSNPAKLFWVRMTPSGASKSSEVDTVTWTDGTHAF
jgi:hypothetical protein